ncbi:hypothetical protein GCM10010124_34340 [Pilimelia terevasa]|uniref:histidine kinase n=1 Tax=Pilimelia terevasa TaxID=53372 RepID=A0A8J3BTH9_9ACTN|nr:nitrate- and nitrite sensing domain-containing protein [Pilimelia terevasa]GGK38677.1 hypothetical protein GCM10010124_34340 [Pilimelia terevasa]
MAVGNGSIRSKITALVLTPLAAVTLLWGFALTLTVGPALNLLHFRTVAENVARPAEVLVTELQRERQLSLVFLAGQAPTPPLDRQRRQTDGAVAAFRRLAGLPGARDAMNPQAAQRVAELVRAVEDLPETRTRVDRREVDRVAALRRYTAVVDTAFRLMPAVTDVSDDELARRTRTLTDLARARELLAQEDALVAGALVAGRFVDAEAGTVSQLVGLRRLLYTDAAAALPETGRQAYRTLQALPHFEALLTMEDLLVARGRAGEAPPVDARRWAENYRAVAAAARAFEVAQAAAVAERAAPVARGIVARLAVAGLLGLLAVVATLLISVRIGRSLVRRVGRLRRAALELAEVRLPSVVARLRRGEPVDVGAETPALAEGADEIGELGHAFDGVQRTAVQAAVDEAAFRQGTSEVFLNIARRSQTLLYRQLAMLDRMERETTDPASLAELYAIDHLSTRLRRHAEDLVILAGATPSRGWREPVPLVDVLRGAVSEVEDYARVDVREVPAAALVGRAVPDVIHLLAELVENATRFSPPRNRVRVTAQEVPAGVAVEVEDRGLGMPADALAEWNRQLAAPPEFDPAASARLGLFVVGRLAARLAVPVQLRPSPYGGVTAVVLLPAALVVALPEPAPAARRGPARAARPGRLRPVPTIPAPRRPAERPADEAPVAGRGLRVPAPRQGQSARTAASTVDGALSEDGLPRRVRQASLVPQLREPTAAASAPPGPPAGARSPQSVRRMMSDLQVQTRRGRAEGSTGDIRADTVTARPADDAGGDASGPSDGEGCA